MAGRKRRKPAPKKKIVKKVKAIGAEQFLYAGADHFEKRKKKYDKPEGERSMANTVKMFNTLTGHNLSEQQGWKFMILLKTVRSEHGPFHADDYEDAAAYCGLAGEAASKTR